VTAFLRALLCLVGLTQLALAQTVDFGRDVLPILSDRCFQCHGPDESDREADLRLDQQQSALEDRGGYAAVVPGHPDQSDLLARITSDDSELRMPPAQSQVKPLTDSEIETIRRWIADGAQWNKHWAFEKPTRSPVPYGDMHPIDAFVRHRLEPAGLQVSATAERHTLLRRLSFDLTGLPPSQDQLGNFLAADDIDSAYRQAIDRMIVSPHYAERMATWWLDVARYADTDGYQGDASRTNWPWRDWVVESFRENMPFDQFTIQQFAGDLLPDPTDSQILATCFHRNHMTNGEGGRDPEESRVEYVIDRVNTTGTVWMGLTVGCAQCHAHKFDPISQVDYYQLSAFFNSIDEDGRAGGGAKPYLKFQSPYAARAVNETQRLFDRRTQLEIEARQQAESEFNDWLNTKIEQTSQGFRPWHELRPLELTSAEGTELVDEPDGMVQATGPNLRQDDYRLVARSALRRITGVRLEVFPHESHTDGKLSRGASGEFILTNFKMQLRQPGSSQLIDLEFASAIADVERGAKGRNYGNIKDTLDDDPRNGWTTEDHDPTKPYVGVFALSEPLELSSDEELIVVMFHRSTVGDANIGRFRLSVTNQPGQAVRSLSAMPLAELAAAKVDSANDVDDKLRTRLLAQFLHDHAEYQRIKSSLDRAKRQLDEMKKASDQLNVMVLARRDQPRKTFVLERGVWDKKGRQVEAGFPAAVLPWPADQARSRLDLARWLVARENPLTARVIVNHLWQMFFGHGLVRTPDDFGLQGERPTHPELLDWLAVELMENDWDLQHLIRLMLSSRTYQQSSVVTSAQLDRDVDNRLLARANRYRLPSWMIRDATLQVSGLLNRSIGGPPVRPYQPPGVWAEIFMGRFRYEPSEGAAQYRRTLYAFWRRSSAPTFLFDSAQRRVCEVSARRTNTPLHALTLLNDKTQLVASAKLGSMAVSESGSTDQRIKWLYGRVLSRQPTSKESNVVAQRWHDAVEHYRAQPDQARQLLETGSSGVASTDVAQRPELAAAMVVASMLLNLDEAITRE
jgi:hypothetical protein